MLNDMNLTELELSILSEVGNIGAGNAANSLSVMINTPVSLNVPEVQLCKLTELSDKIAGAEEIRTGIMFGVAEGLNGFICFILEDSDVKKLVDIFGYDMEATLILSEIGNIISGAYVGALSSLMDEFINISPPECSRDMTGALLDSLISHLSSAADETVFIKTEMKILEKELTSYYVLLLEQDSLIKLIDKMKKSVG